MIKRRHVIRLSLREYLPLLFTVALWAVILAAIGHADTARLFAATVTMRAIQMFTRMSTAPALRARAAAPPAVRRQARRTALVIQGGVLLANLILITALVVALDGIGQDAIAAFLPLIAIGLPARWLRYSDGRTDTPYSRLALSAGGLAAAAAGWALGLGAVGMALAFGLREWIAYVAIRATAGFIEPSNQPTDAPLHFAEVARKTALSGRRLLTYRISKIALTLFGPVGNFAARTGRGLNWHNRIEPYLPHRLTGFLLFAIAGLVGAAFLALRSGEPSAMVGAAALLQLSGAAGNIAAMWHWLPDRKDPNLVVDDDDDD